MATEIRTVFGCTTNLLGNSFRSNRCSWSSTYGRNGRVACGYFESTRVLRLHGSCYWRILFFSYISHSQGIYCPHSCGAVLHHSCAYKLLMSTRISDESAKGKCPGCNNAWIADISQFSDSGRIYSDSVI